MGAATSIISCPDKSFVATKYFCHSRHFVITSILFVATKKQILSWQTRICCDKTFVATKVILAAAAAKDKALL